MTPRPATNGSNSGKNVNLHVASDTTFDNCQLVVSIANCAAAYEFLSADKLTNFCAPDYRYVSVSHLGRD